MRIIYVESGAEIKPSNGTLQSLISLEQKTKAVNVPFWQYPEFLHNFIPFWCVILEQRPLNWSRTVKIWWEKAFIWLFWNSRAQAGGTKKKSKNIAKAVIWSPRFSVTKGTVIVVFAWDGRRRAFPYLDWKENSKVKVGQGLSCFL